ncbi:hypothetical protein [Streptomyces venezuelae]|uniref:hypothetical protein n=1 Tax=Streptomyces venezuelae TaxID=54571 RepID=UPI001682A815|nr:hypothetical protein [Streptomyces venezuelae]
MPAAVPAAPDQAPPRPRRLGEVAALMSAVTVAVAGDGKPGRGELYKSLTFTTGLDGNGLANRAS